MYKDNLAFRKYKYAKILDGNVDLHKDPDIGIPDDSLRLITSRIITSEIMKKKLHRKWDDERLKSKMHVIITEV